MWPVNSDLDVEADELAAEESAPGWQRRAVGMDTGEALALIPRTGTLQAHIRIEDHRILDVHIRRMGITRAQFLRDAVADRFRRTGGDPAVAARIRQGMTPTRRKVTHTPPTVRH